MNRLSREQYEAFQKASRKVIAKAWTDPDFKKRLINEPQKVFKENGFELPTGLEYKINTNSDKILYFNLPVPPEEGLREEQLKSLVAGDDFMKWLDVIGTSI
jgi:hypothetical protein